ncbi:MAG: alkaline phosphatase family protein [Bdellovibrionales bacterium]|nr:alkaline phosphatase family protein [Bdellovibrionales bacterium]
MQNFVLILILLLSIRCTQVPKEWSLDANPQSGQLSIIQTTTSENETFINILRGKNASYTYTVELAGNKVGAIRKYKTVSGGPLHHWRIDKLHISRLQPNVTYDFVVYNSKLNYEVDRRRFSTLTLDKKNVQFVIASCMSDHHRFGHIREQIWQQVSNLNPDLILMIGDNVYVDDFDFVDRKSVSKFDIWQRYIDTLRIIPFYRQKKLIPVLATWDDHDYGLNNSGKGFTQKWNSLDVFKTIYMGLDIPGVAELSKSSVYNEFIGFGQKFLLLDNRFFRDKSNSKSKYAYLGKRQQKWLISKLNKDTKPTWVIAGGQFFSPTYKLKNGKQVNESFMADYPINYRGFVSDLKSSSSPIAFLSGDVHYSEIMEIESDILGYTSYEITSSPLHSYLFRANKEQDEFFKNTRRIAAVKDYNFIYIDSFIENNLWHINVKSYGPKQEDPFFTKNLIIKR